jgi:aspartyl-tRNA(Asn)/glutamyl-tRNA(Gln) amidotransferase subunit A
VIARAERLQPQLNCLAVELFDEAREKAKQAENDVAQERPLGPLHGVPITVKDGVATAGHRLPIGSFAFENNVATTDVLAAARIKSAGAIIVGKTTTPECYHKVLTEHSDGSRAGQFRLLFLRGSYGEKRARSRLLASVMEGNAGHDVHSQRASREQLVYCEPANAVRGLRVGWIPRFRQFRVETEVTAAAQAAIARLEADGSVVEILPDTTFDNVFDTYVVIATTAHAARFGGLIDQLGDRLTSSLRESILQGRTYSAIDLQRAADQRTLLFRRVQDLSARYPDAHRPCQATRCRRSDQHAALCRVGECSLPIQSDRTSCGLRAVWLHCARIAHRPATSRAVGSGGQDTWRCCLLRNGGAVGAPASARVNGPNSALSISPHLAVGRDAIERLRACMRILERSNFALPAGRW